MTMGEIIDCARRPLGLMALMSEDIASLVEAGIVTASPATDGFVIVRIVPVHVPSPYVNRPKRPNWSKPKAMRKLKHIVHQQHKKQRWLVAVERGAISI